MVNAAAASWASLRASSFRPCSDTKSCVQATNTMRATRTDVRTSPDRPLHSKDTPRRWCQRADRLQEDHITRNVLRPHTRQHHEPYASAVKLRWRSTSANSASRCQRRTTTRRATAEPRRFSHNETCTAVDTLRDRSVFIATSTASPWVKLALPAPASTCDTAVR